MIVLMLENRSYDHLFGFLGHPGIPDLEPERYPNGLTLDEYAPPGEAPAPPPAPPPPVLPSPTASPRLAFDPPHGHVSALAQMHDDGHGRFLMDGFVDAYAQKLAGLEHVPIVHWRAVRWFAAGAGVVLAGGLHDVARRGVLGSWSAWGRLGVGGVVAYGGVAQAAKRLRVDAIPGIRPRNIQIASAAIAGAAAASGLGWWRWASVGRRGAVAWTAATVAAGQAVVSVAQDRMKVRARVHHRHLANASAAVMRCFPPERIPVLATLAKRYGICTAWHSSVPGATWPNRNFAHAATSDESVDIEIGLYDDDTVFQRLDEQRAGDDARRRAEGLPVGGTGDDRPAPWGIYHHDTPQVVAFQKLWATDQARSRWFDAERLLDHIRADRLPHYAFVEPCHTGPKANSQHPGNNEEESAIDFERGEELVHSIYAALAATPEVFEKTAFIVTYDEHGGLFDHVPPPATVHPEPDRAERSRELARRLLARFVEHRNRPFAFGVLGPRVPAIVISPWIPAGTVDGDRIYDHASIVATVRRLFAPDTEPLTLRDRYANDLLGLLGAPGEPDHQPAEFPASFVPADGAESLVAEFPAESAVWTELGEPVLAREGFGDQLGRLSFLVRERLAPGSEPAEAGRGVPAPLVLKAAAQASRSRVGETATPEPEPDPTPPRPPS